jgi:hypothetical protein
LDSLRAAANYPPDVVAQKLAGRVRRVWRARRPPRPLSDAAFARLLAGPTDAPTAFHLDPARRADYVAEMARRWPEERDRILAEADAVASTDWHRDPITGKRWPLDHFSRIDYLALGDPCDVKRVWEPSRQQSLVTLGQAYWLTGDEAHAERILASVGDWIDGNPPELGVNWTVAMEAALRIVSWAWAWHFVSASPALTGGRRRAWLESVWRHARFILENLEHTERSGNHLLADALGLLYAGVAFPFFREARTWRARGLGLLWSELPRQVFPDGVDYEGSTSYHRFVLDLLLDARLLAARAGEPAPPGIDARLTRMIAFSSAVAGPDGLGPMLGDADDGFVWRFHPRASDDHRPALALGALALGTPREEGRLPPEALWLGGPEGCARLDTAPIGRPLAAAAFPHGGVFVLGDAHSRGLVDCGHLGLGAGGRGGHGHLDTLSLVLWADGVPVLIDPGTFTYTGDLEWRRAFRETAAHNTLRIDGVDQAELTGPWSLENRCHPTLHRWSAEDERVFFDGSHSGFERLPGRPRHRRQILLLRGRGWLVVDLIEGQGRHLIERFWHFAPGVLSLRPNEAQFGGCRLAWPPDPPLTCRVVVGDEASRQGWISRRYGDREPAPVLTQRVEVELPVRLPLAIALRPEVTPAELFALEQPA